ncbi:hypothetical protein ACFOWE_18140 [Planomonospora corallina]|uniref:XRE family transcriptional regulator n=1 Tax=Planomonospora corallina TaxID=1806052 RepID=A0ABV8I7P1_9ACTN
MQEPHQRECALAIRALALAAHPGGPLPAAALHELAERIHTCCGHTRLKSARLARGWSIPDVLARLAELADDAGLPARGTDERRWRRWEQGERPDDDYRDRLARLFATGPVQLGFATDYTPHTPGGGPTDRRDVLRLGSALPGLLLPGTAGHAWELTRRAEETDVGASTLDQVRQAIELYGTRYPLYSADELAHAASGDRSRVADLLQLRTTLKQRRELYVAAAWLSIVLAWAAHDRGDVRAALAWAADARHHGDQADHDETVAWAWDVEATVWLYEDRPAEALRAAEHGAARAPAGSAARARLAGQVARARAGLGDGAAAETLQVLRGQAEQLPVHATGLFSADAARVWSVAATCSLWLGDPGQARAFAAQALDVYSRDPRLAPSRHAITSLDLALACARLGDADQAVAYGLDALATPRPVAAIAARSATLGAVLERSYPGATAVAQFQQRRLQVAGPA